MNLQNSKQSNYESQNPKLQSKSIVRWLQQTPNEIFDSMLCTITWQETDSNRHYIFTMTASSACLNLTDL